jgi:putative transposase
MPPQLRVTEKQGIILQRILRRATSPQNLVLRAKIVQAGTEYGRRDTQIGQDLNCHPQTVRTWRHRWLNAWESLLETEAIATEQDLEAVITEVLSDRPRPGTPAKFTAEEICQIINIACEEPALSGRPITEWTPRELADEAVKREIVESISPTQVGRFLKRGGFETASKPILVEQQAR